MRDQRPDARSRSWPVAAPAPEERPPWWRRRGVRWTGAASLAVTVAAVWGIVAWRSRSAPPIVRTPDEILADAELAAIRAMSASEIPVESLPRSTREWRRRADMVKARADVLDGHAERAVESLEQLAQDDPASLGGMYRSLLVRALRAADRAPRATTVCEAWLLSLRPEDPERSWAESELALDLAWRDQIDEADQLLAPWLGVSLEPAAAVRLRLAEAMVRSAHGDHGVACAALENAISMDRRCALADRFGRAELLPIAMDLQQAAFSAGEFAVAVQLGEHVLELAGDSPARREALRRHAASCRAEAGRLLAAHGAGASEGAERVNRLLITAAEAARLHADLLGTDASGEVPALRSASLLTAAECWDLADRSAPAVSAWRAWLAARPESDPRRAEVLWHIAESLHGEAHFAEASVAYEQLLRAYPNSPLAAKCPVAMARALRAQNQEEAAAALLDRVLDGRAGIDPDSPGYLAALVESGRLAHAMGRYADSSRKLEEALRRGPRLPEVQELRLLLGDSRRAVAISLEARLGGELTSAERQEASRARDSEWRGALDEFSAVVAWLDARDLAPDDHDAASISMFARLGVASALQALGRSDDSRLSLEEIDRRHPGSQASLVALACLGASGALDPESLRERAARRLALADDSSPALMSRDAWAAWFGLHSSTGRSLVRGPDTTPSGGSP